MLTLPDLPEDRPDIAADTLRRGLPSVWTAREDGYGRVGWLYLDGHVDPETATALFWSYIAADPDEEFLDRIEAGEASPTIARGGPVHTWLYRRDYDPDNDDPDGEGCEFYEHGPEGPGGVPVTYADISAPPWEPCYNWPACHDRRITEIPVQRFCDIDPDDPKLTRRHSQLYVPYCREHAADYDRRYREAVAAARAERVA